MMFFRSYYNIFKIIYSKMKIFFLSGWTGMKMLRENREEIGMKREKSFNQKKKERKREKSGKVYRFLLKYCIFILYSTVIFSYLKISLSFCDFYNNLSRQQSLILFATFLCTHLTPTQKTLVGSKFIIQIVYLF